MHCESAKLQNRLAAALPDGWTLRTEATDNSDSAFLCALYASTRQQEPLQVPWSEVQKSQFLNQQFQLQTKHFQQHCTKAAFWLLLRGADPIGRIYVHVGATEWRLIDIALLPEARRLGIGSALITALQTQARGSGQHIGLHVELHNPARHLYQRLGFQLLQPNGTYHYMRWPPEAQADF